MRGASGRPPHPFSAKVGMERENPNFGPLVAPLSSRPGLGRARDTGYCVSDVRKNYTADRSDARAPSEHVFFLKSTFGRN